MCNKRSLMIPVSSKYLIDKKITPLYTRNMLFLILDNISYDMLTDFYRSCVLYIYCIHCWIRKKWKFMFFWPFLGIKSSSDSKIRFTPIKLYIFRKLNKYTERLKPIFHEQSQYVLAVVLVLKNEEKRPTGTISKFWPKNRLH